MDELQNDGAVTDRQDEGPADTVSPAPSLDEVVVPESAVSDSSAASAIANLPAISNWKSAPLFSLLGCWVSGMWRNLFYSILPLDLRCLPVAAIIVLYVLLFYSSYFTEKPRVKSSETISFLNYACVGIIFGYCFNKNLKESKSAGYPAKGLAPSVAVFLWIALALGSFGYYNFTASGRLAKQYTYNSTTDSYESIGDNDTSSSIVGANSSAEQDVIVPKTTTKITIPAGWKHHTVKQNYDTYGPIEGLVIEPPYVNEDTWVSIIAWNMAAYFEKGMSSDEILYKEYVIERNRDSVDVIESESADLTGISGVEYWKAQTKGTYSGLPITNTAYYCIDGVTLYQFMFSSLDESQEVNDALEADLEGILASAKYSSMEDADQPDDTFHYSNAELGISFSAPSGWYSESLDKERDYIRWKAYPDDSNLAGITYGVMTGLAQYDASDLTAEDLKGMATAYLRDCNDESVDRITLNGIDYWRMQGSGVLEQGGMSVPASITSLMLIRGDNAHMFTFYDFRDEPNTPPYYDDFISMVENVDYE